MLLRAILPFMLIAIHSIASADWIRTSGPEGGTIRSVSVGPNATLAVTYDGRIYRDNSGVWMSIGILPASIITPVGNAFLAATASGVFRSSDNGSFWTPVFPSTIFSTAMSVDRGIAYVSVNDSIFKSIDEGEHWTFVTHQTNITSCITVSGDTMLIGSAVGMGLQRSTNGGATFSTVTNGLPFSSGIVNSLQRVGTEFFASIGQSGMFRSTDGGFSWELRSTGLPQFDVTSYYAANRMLVLGTNLYAVANNKVYRYDGSVWSILPLDYAVADIGGAGTMMISGTNAGIWRSTNNGTSWEESNEELIATTTSALVKRNSDVFALVPGRTALTTNNGSTWTFPGRIDASRLVVHGTSLFAATFSGVSRSTDNGATWAPVNQGITQYLPDLRDIAATDNTIYASFFYVISLHGNSSWSSGGVFRSTNNGESWVPVNTGLPRNAFSVVAPTHRVAANGQSVFAATVAGVFRTTNSGANWISAGAGIPASTWVETLHNTASYVLCGTNRGVFRFNGSAWEEMNNGFPQPNGSYPYAYSFVEFNGSLYAATSAGVFRYDGTSWSSFGTGDPTTSSVSSIVELNGDLLAAVPSKGVWKTSLTVDVDENPVLPKRFMLEQNYPNPFNPSTRITFEVPGSGLVVLKVYDVLGREVATLENEGMKPGSHTVSFNGSDLAGGVYFYRLQAGEFTQTRRLMLLK